jgi:hypothetical protein
MRFLMVLGLCGHACVRLFGMHVVVALRAKALPDLVDAGDNGSRGHRFPPWGHC